MYPPLQSWSGGASRITVPGSKNDTSLRVSGGDKDGIFPHGGIK